MSRRAVLLLNLGSPDSTAVPDVKRYLREFLSDERVIDRPGQPWRWMLVNWLIVPFRGAKSAHAYSRIWLKEGSPLIVTSQRVRDLLQARADYPVLAAMNYGNPSIEKALGDLVAQGVDEVLLFPQYPHYAMSSWETVIAKVHRVAATVAPNMRFTTVQPYFGDADYIDALVASAQPYLSAPYDHLLFSYHGIPVRHLTKADSSQAHCQKVADCCVTCSPAHATCYKAQVTRTTHLFAARAGLDPAKWSISFQSRLGREPWIEPYTDFEFVRLASSGKKRLLVITPAFVTDCLETLEEIRMTGAESFLNAGGESFTHIPCLNDQPVWLEFLAQRIGAWNTGVSAQNVTV
ncbi:MAG TPA: ferrochelatase [Candidatus Didemnitutus sp.]|nr:ferrochelatase [Candidatus Didemnitutus sp.]